MTPALPMTAQLVAGIPALPRARLEFQTAREVDRLGLADCARAGLVWVQVAARHGPPVVVVTAEDGQHAVSPAAALMRLCGGRPDCQWTTRAGGRVRWTGPAARPRNYPGGLSATATNDLIVVDVGGRPAVLKVYRVQGSDRDESTVLATLNGAFTPRPLARISYRPPAGGPAMCLAVITERVPGQTLDGLLLESLRQSWSAGRSALDRPTVMTLARVRSALSGLHAALEHRCAPRVCCDPGRAAHARRKALRAEVRALLSEDQEQAGTARAACAGAMAVLTAAEAAAGRTTWLDAAPAHGDLHLAHVLVDGEQVRFVDVARPEPHSSRADDGAALRRAVECHDLRHHRDRGDGYHARLAWCHLIQACSGAAPQVPRGQRHEGARCTS